MTILRPLGVALALLAAASLAVGAAGFSDVSAERGVEVSVVDDESAYVGVTACTNGDSEGNVVHLRVTNRFLTAFEVTAITSDDAAVARGGSEEPMGPGGGDSSIPSGQERKLTQKFDDGVETVEVEVSGTGFEATVTRDVEQSLGNDCPGQGSSERGAENGRSGGNPADDASGTADTENSTDAGDDGTADE